MSGKNSCCVCGQPFTRTGEKSYMPCCEKCEVVWHICFTSVEDGIRSAKTASDDELAEAFQYELISSWSRKSLRQAIAREISRRLRQEKKAKA